MSDAEPPFPQPIPEMNKSVMAPHRPPEVDQYVDKFLSAVCDTSRRYILELLALSDDKTNTDPAAHEKRSGDIAKAIGLSAATTSEHLRHLVKVGLLTSRREGNMVHYRLCNHKLVQAFQDFIQALDDDYKNRQVLDDDCKECQAK